MRRSHPGLTCRLAAACALLILACAPAANAQGSATIFVGATGIGPLSGTADRFKIGFGVDAGASFDINEQMSIRGDWVFGNLGQAGDWPQPPLPVPFTAKLRTQFATVDFVFSGPPSGARVYVMAGVGLYHRRVELTAGGSGSAEVCDPWWFVCTDGEVSFTQIVGTRSHTTFGVNVGAGVRFSRFFVEARYHYAAGPTFETPAGRQTATGKFFPVTFGVTF